MKNLSTTKRQRQQNLTNSYKTHRLFPTYNKALRNNTIKP